MSDFVTRAEFEAFKNEVRDLSRKPAGAGTVADDADLDGQYGNPSIRYDPKTKYWSGDSFVGSRFSECSAVYLDATARYLDACAYMANKDGDTKKAGYKTKDAARARGWAARIRAGWKPVRVGDAYEGDADGYGDEELPL